ncbi:hypothetical protein LTS18_014643, partial [Coniosporium uncinatum]
MAQTFPYTYYRCPCVDTSTPTSVINASKRASVATPDAPGDEEERTFDPQSPRANYSLYPLEHLLYCT